MNLIKQLLPAFALSLAAQAAMAAYPDRPIRLVVGYAAGGTTDILARALGEELSKTMNTSVVVENKPGAAGSLGAATVQNSKPDGYTLFIATVSSHGMNPALYSSLNYKPIEGFEPVSMLASIPLVLVSDPKRNYKTVQDLIDDAQAKPGTLNYSSSGNGSPVHVAGALFADAKLLDIMHVPYRGGAMANTAVMAGDAQFTFATMPAALPHIKAKNLDALAVTTRERATQLPDVPTMAETAGFEDYEINTWNALLAPAGTPQDILDTLSIAVTKVMNSPKLRASFAHEGAIPKSSTPEELSKFIEQQIGYWDKVVKKLKLQIS